MQFLNPKISALRLICLICISNIALAQTITYETVVVLPLDALTVDYDRDNFDENQTLRLLFTYQLNAPVDDDELKPIFFDTWYRLAKADKLTCYIDAVMSNKTKVKWLKVDTLVGSCEPVGPEDEFKVVENDYDIAQITEYAVLHRFTYNTKTHKTTCEIPAFAPILTVKDDRGNFQYKKEMAWIKNDAKISKKTKLIWSKRTNLSLKNTDLVPINNPNDPDFSTVLLAQAKNNELKLYPILDGGWHLPPEKINFTTVDTVVTYHPETYAEIIRLDTLHLEAADVKSMRFKMSYFFETNPFRLSAKIERIGLVKDVHDDKGNFRYNTPVFFIKPE